MKTKLTPKSKAILKMLPITLLLLLGGFVAFGITKFLILLLACGIFGGAVLLAISGGMDLEELSE